MNIQLINQISKTSKTAILFSFIALIIYTLLILISPHKLIYDEGYYISIAHDYIKLGFTNEFIRNISAPTGILYSLVHSLFSPITNLTAPSIRFINLALMLCSYLLIFTWLGIVCRKDSETSLLISAMWLAVPTAGVIGCMALTEIPAICLCLASSICIAYAYNEGKWRSNLLLTVIGLIASGLLLGLSTWGRQNFIVVLLASIPLFLPITKRSIVFGAVYSLSALSFFIYPVSIWQGLVPPTVSFVEKGYRVSNFILSCSYLGFISAIIYPKILIVGKKITSLILGLSALIVLIYSDLRYLPSQNLVERLTGTTGAAIASYVFGAFFVSLSLIFIYSLLKECILYKGDYKLLYCAISILLICLSNIKITHQFSSRYITLAIPFMLYILSNKLTIGKLFPIKFFVSLGLSTLFLYNYYLSH